MGVFDWIYRGISMKYYVIRKKFVFILLFVMVLLSLSSRYFGVTVFAGSSDVGTNRENAFSGGV